MATDRADEIAREIDDWLLDHAARPARQHKIAAALRSYAAKIAAEALRRVATMSATRDYDIGTKRACAEALAALKDADR